MKPDVLQRLDAYCAIYGVGRGRAIGHLLKGALPDPNWLPATTSFLPREINQEAEDSFTSELSTTSIPDHTTSLTGRVVSETDPSEEVSEPQFHCGDRVSNNSGSRLGRIADDSLQWIDSTQLNNGEWRAAHWSYAVAWDGQAGLTIRYAEDLLRPEDPIRQAG